MSAEQQKTEFCATLKQTISDCFTCFISSFKAAVATVDSKPTTWNQRGFGSKLNSLNNALNDWKCLVSSATGTFGFCGHRDKWVRLTPSCQKVTFALTEQLHPQETREASDRGEADRLCAVWTSCGEVVCIRCNASGRRVDVYAARGGLQGVRGKRSGFAWEHSVRGVSGRGTQVHRSALRSPQPARQRAAFWDFIGSGGTLKAQSAVQWLIVKSLWRTGCHQFSSITHKLTKHAHNSGRLALTHQ